MASAPPDLRLPIRLNVVQSSAIFAEVVAMQQRVMLTFRQVTEN